MKALQVRSGHARSGRLAGRLAATLLAMALGSMTAVAEAAVPAIVTVEGVLRGVGGTVVADGSYKLSFALYKESLGGTPLWSEPGVVVGVQGGVFSQVLGTAVALKAETLAGLSQVWFSVTVEGDPELPRRPLASVPFSLRAGLAEGLDCTGCVTMAMLDPSVLAPYAKTADLAAVAKSGAYADLKGVPDLGVYAKATDLGAYAKSADLGAFAKSADLAAVAKSGAYADLKGSPDLGVYAKSADLAAYAKSSSLAAVASSGAYADLQGAPNLGIYAQIANLAAVATSGNYSDLKGLPNLGVYAKSADLAAVATSASYADLQGAPKLGTSCGTGLVLAGFKADGTFDCIAALDANNLPKDALGVVSNGLLTDVTADTVQNATAVPIKDNNPIGVNSVIAWPDFGTVQGITVSVDLTNSDTKSVKVTLIAPDNSLVVLYDKSASGTSLKASYSDKSTLADGSLAPWVGKNPKGNWTLTVIDTGFSNNGNDGQLSSWSIAVQTLSGKKVQAKGGLQFFNSTSDPVACDAAQAGLTYFNTTAKAVYICNGTQYFPLSLVPFGSQQNPAASCNDLLLKAPGTKDGQYWITLGGQAVQVTCDMTNDGGGWTALELESVGTNATAIAAGWSDGTLTNASVAGAGTVVHGVWGAGGGAFKTYNTPPHAQMRVTGRYYAIDSWDNEGNGAQMIVDGNLRWSATKSYSQPGSGNGWTTANFTPAPWGNNSGPNGYWTLAAAVGNSGILAHSGNTLKLEFRTGIDQDKSDESFAFSHVQLWVK
jgi:subtilisin-like proprotein convertase family protein